MQTIIAARSNPQYFAFVPPEATDGIKAGRSVWLGDEDRKDAPIAQVRADLKSAQLPFLSWDTEGGDRAKLNLLLAPVTLSARIGTKETVLSGTGKLQGENGAVFQLSAPDAGITWNVQVEDGGIRMSFAVSGKGLKELGGLALTFPFDPRATATGPVGGEWTSDEKLRLPTLLHAPDLGAMRVSSPEQPELLCRWEGSRGRVGCWATLTIEIPPLQENVATTLRFEPYHLPQPQGLTDANRWKAARRGWMNLLQTSTQRPAEAHYRPCPAGVWANNIISDPVSATLFWLADHVMLTFHKYLNGGACVSNTSFWLLANYIAGRKDRADQVLDAMLERQRRGVFPNGGAFQNGIIDRAGAGAEFFDWEGNTTGYEGHLVYSWTWMHALFARDGIYQAKALQPLK